MKDKLIFPRNDSLPDFPFSYSSHHRRAKILYAAPPRMRSGMQNGAAVAPAPSAPCSRIKLSIHLAVFDIAIFIMNSRSWSRKRFGRVGVYFTCARTLPIGYNDIIWNLKKCRHIKISLLQIVRQIYLGWHCVFHHTSLFRERLLCQMTNHMDR